jgi:pyruvate dehydrogenase E2 component (dihydrolipoamide acetyltransferase)
MDLKLPPLGEGVDSGSVVGILVREGDHIAKGQGIIELETGKAVAPVPSQIAGKVAKFLVSVGDKITVGQAILSLEEDAAAPAKVAALAPAARPARAVAPPPASASQSEGAGWVEEEPAADAPAPAASPTIRRLARELGIDLRRIHGSESGSRIVMDDVRAYIQRLQQRAAQPQPRTDGAPVASKAPPPRIDFGKWGAITKRPMTSLRKAIAAQLSESWLAAPRVTQFDEADITVLNELRKKHAETYEKKGARLTLTSFALQIVADALRLHPVFNTSLDEAAGDVIYKEYCHIGLAVDTGQGLIVPVLRDADKKDLLTLSKEMNEIAAKTRDRKISLEELQGGSFTISNQGGIGGGHFTPIINRPETAILGLGRGTMKAVVRDGKIEPRLMLPMALSYDHRIIDGADAVRFMLDLVKGFENFDEKRLGQLES